eukprot:evm.model.scf_60.12 EVM.evm.TU.scf_60.12   scf_60:107396-108031(+)
MLHQRLVSNMSDNRTRPLYEATRLQTFVQVKVPDDILFFSGVVDSEGESDEVLFDILPEDTPCAVETGVDFPGNDIEQVTTDTTDECCRLCENHFGPDGTTPDCFAWTRNTETGLCTLKNKIAPRTFENEGLVGATVF